MKISPFFSRFFIAVFMVAVSLGFSSCGTTSKSVSRGNTGDSFDPPAQRPQNPAAVVLKVSTGAQRVYVVENGRVLLATPCSVGTGGTTGQGNYRINSKIANKRRISSPGAGYPMAYWQEWKPAYGMHWGFVKPYPCTHGCIRLPMKSAAKIFAMTQVGTPISIQPSHPEDATAGKSLPVLDDSPVPNPPNSYLNSAKFFQDAQYKGNMFVN